MRKITLSSLLLLFTLGASAQGIPTLDLSELQQRLYQKNDTTYVVNFWATWCGPCVKELPFFEEFAQAHKDEKVKVILVSLDFTSAKNSRLIPFVEKYGITSEVIHFVDASPPNSWIPQFSDKWSGSIPATLVLNGKKGVNDFYEKSFDSVRDIESVLKGR